MIEGFTEMPAEEIFTHKEIERLKFQEWRLNQGMQDHSTNDPESQEFMRRVRSREKVAKLMKK